MNNGCISRKHVFTRQVPVAAAPLLDLCRRLSEAQRVESQLKEVGDENAVAPGTEGTRCVKCYIGQWAPSCYGWCGRGCGIATGICFRYDDNNNYNYNCNNNNNNNNNNYYYYYYYYYYCFFGVFTRYVYRSTSKNWSFRLTQHLLNL